MTGEITTQHTNTKGGDDVSDNNTDQQALQKIREALARGGVIQVTLPHDADASDKRADERARENREAQVEFNNRRDERERAVRDALMRELTAATILTALLPIAVQGMATPADDPQVVARAVALADALRAELKGRP